MAVPLVSNVGHIGCLCSNGRLRVHARGYQKANNRVECAVYSGVELTDSDNGNVGPGGDEHNWTAAELAELTINRFDGEGIAN